MPATGERGAAIGRVRGSRAEQAACPAGGRARRSASPRPPRPRPIRDAILAYLTEPRTAAQVAARIGRPTPTATGHLAAMRRLGLVRRLGHSAYALASYDGPGLEWSPSAGAFVPARPRPFARKGVGGGAGGDAALVAFVSGPRTVAEVAARAGPARGHVAARLRALARAEAWERQRLEAPLVRLAAREAPARLGVAA